MIVTGWFVLVEKPMRRGGQLFRRIEVGGDLGLHLEQEMQVCPSSGPVELAPVLIDDGATDAEQRAAARSALHERGYIVGAETEVSLLIQPASDVQNTRETGFWKAVRNALAGHR